MRYEVRSPDIILYEDDFDLDETLDCGQAFRWEKFKDGYQGYYVNKYLYISGSGGRFVLHETTEDDFLKIWFEYFDLGRDYSALKSTYSCDETMKNACLFAKGIRLLKQDKWEALCSFIISQNNNMPRIKGIIGRLCEHYGGFPTPLQMKDETPESLEFLRSGFRAKYLCDAVKRVLSGETDLEAISKMPVEEARKALEQIKGVGPKVADCVLLYGMNRVDAFPRDVWIKRAEQRFYPNGLPDCIKGTEGIAQQFLFHYIRNIGNQ